MPLKYPEEDHARNLYADLTGRCADSHPKTEIGIEGAGVHWHCKVQRADRSCSIACFDLPRNKGPEYLTSFKQETIEIATGRTRSKPETIDAVADWLKGESLSKLYQRFPFVDRCKRAFVEIREEMHTRVPRLAEAAPGELKHWGNDIYYLWFTGGERSCQLSFWGDNDCPDAMFHWDRCELFRYRVTDRTHLAAVLKRWLCDVAMPSALRSEFPEVEIGELADYYERGIPIEGEFVQSWNAIEEFYLELTPNKSESPFAEIRHLVGQIRARGYDHCLRAGQSMAILVLSRSRRHGLRRDQPSISFHFRENGFAAHADFDGLETVTHSKIEFTPELDVLLQKLAAKAID